MAIKEVSGKLFQSDRVIRCVAVNCSGNVTGDFAKEIKEKYPEVIKPYTEMCRVAGEKALGEVQFNVCHDGTIIACMFVQEVGVGNRAVVDMGALEDCLDRICIFSVKTQFPTGIPENLGLNPKYVDWKAVKQLVSAYLDINACGCQIIMIPPKQQRKGKAAAETTEGTPNETPRENPGTTEAPATTEAPPTSSSPEETSAAPASMEEAPAAAEEAPAALAETPKATTADEKPKEVEKRRVVVIHVETAGQDSQDWVATLSVKAGKKQIRGTAGANPPALTGAVTALCAIKTPCNVVLYADDKNLVEAIQQGVEGKDGLWKKVQELMCIHNVVAHHSSEIPAEKAG